MTRETVYGELLSAVARPLHAKIADSLESNPDGRTAELAYHYWKAKHAAKAVHHNEQAGDHAVALHAYQDGATYYRRALSFDATPCEMRARQWAKLANALQRSGSYERSLQAYSDAVSAYQTAGDLESAARVNINVARLHLTNANMHAHFDHAERALKLVTSRPQSPVWFSAQIELALHHTLYRFDRAYDEPSHSKASRRLKINVDFSNTARS